MKILFTIPTLGTGGAERVASILANHFSRNNEVAFFVFEQSDVERYHIDERIVVKQADIAVKRGNKLRVILNYLSSFVKQRKALCEEIVQFQPDVVISFLPKADLLTYTVARKRKLVWIPSERNDPIARSKIERWILNHIYRNASVLVCQTEKVARYYEEQGVKSTCVIRNPLILETDVDMQVDVPERYFITVGRLDKQKNFGMLIDAFAKAVKDGDCHDKLLILGDGPYREMLSRQIQAHGLEDAVILAGRKTNVNSYLKNAKAFVMSSNYEGLPNAMLEAMAAGLPVISTDFFTGAAREFVDEENGIVVPVGDREAMTAAILRLSATETDVLCRMGQASRQKVQPLAVDKICQDWTVLVQKEKA